MPDRMDLVTRAVFSKVVSCPAIRERTAHLGAQPNTDPVEAERRWPYEWQLIDASFREAGPSTRDENPASSAEVAQNSAMPSRLGTLVASVTIKGEPGHVDRSCVQSKWSDCVLPAKGKDQRSA